MTISGPEQPHRQQNSSISAEQAHGKQTERTEDKSLETQQESNAMLAATYALLEMMRTGQKSALLDTEKLQANRDKKVDLMHKQAQQTHIRVIEDNEYLGDEDQASQKMQEISTQNALASSVQGMFQQKSGVLNQEGQVIMSQSSAAANAAQQTMSQFTQFCSAFVQLTDKVMR